jgi:hypothetical protein
MTEPTQHDRCHGGTAYTLCEKREACGRYTRKPMAHAWYLHPQIPGPCVYFQPMKDAPRE